MDEVVSMTIPASPEYVRVVREIVGEAAGLAGLRRKEGKDLALAVAEGCANVIQHCYGGQEGKITVRCLVGRSELEVRIRDFGRKPDPATIRSRDLADIRPGGLGVFLMQNLVDDVRYNFTHPIGTELILKKTKANDKRDKTNDD
ncbi:MAG: ATP-binding protein [Planctomycetota bacterium]